jgi:hypothetical protein
LSQLLGAAEFNKFMKRETSICARVHWRLLDRFGVARDTR